MECRDGTVVPNESSLIASLKCALEAATTHVRRFAGVIRVIIVNAFASKKHAAIILFNIFEPSSHTWKGMWQGLT